MRSLKSTSLTFSPNPTAPMDFQNRGGRGRGGGFRGRSRGRGGFRGHSHSRFQSVRLPLFTLSSV
ncbi:hypothetical protein K450DRAFT_250575 [Umbelopsis ramanniana AG]|uniref:Uncharacterized protein n=1 Tax=Umbelopsis ramanniana AG TaxID=1314678 RepID=A0AAD5E5W7_UMBRA|nr:uncharacterized protein K450DRAFT_250575 [Umbelopsis ramanniana AG]KAI8577733.1 hypothetical protein K450DRAFT_250575 [Umbelopsis ramanniana AG]